MILKAQGITKTFFEHDKKLEILKDISVEIDTAQTLAIQGKSGSGKSTLLSILAGLLPPDHGEVHLSKKSFYRLGATEKTKFRAKNIGFIFQRYHLIPTLTVYENICLPLEILKLKISRTEVMSLLEKTEIAGRADFYPHQLSGGEMQRVAICRALVHQPSLIFADEPNANLDEQTGDAVMKMMFDLVAQEKKAMILVTHDTTLAKLCQRRFQLHNGVLSDF